MFKKHKTIFLTVFLVVFLFMLLPTTAKATGLSGWPFSTPLAVGNAPTNEANPTTEKSGVIKIGPIDTATLISQGKMRSDCGDIRIADESNVITNRLIVGCNTSQTYVFFNSSVPANNSKQFWLYHGKLDATGSNSLTTCQSDPLLCSETPVVDGTTFNANWYHFTTLYWNQNGVGCTFTNPDDFSPLVIRNGTVNLKSKTNPTFDKGYYRILQRTFWMKAGNYKFMIAEASNAYEWEEITIKFYDTVTGELISCDLASLSRLSYPSEDRGHVWFTNNTDRYVTVLLYQNYTQYGNSYPPNIEMILYSDTKSLSQLTTSDVVGSDVIKGISLANGDINGLVGYLPTLDSLNVPSTIDGAVPTAVSVNASNETNDTMQYKWVVEGGYADPIGTASTTIRIGVEGQKTVKAKVWSQAQGETYAVYFPATATVRNPIYNATLSCPETANLNQEITCTLTAEKSNDLTYSYNWNVSEATIVQNNGNSVILKWTSPGEKQVSATITAVGYANFTRTASANVNATVDFTLNGINCQKNNPKVGESVNCQVSASTFYGTLKYKWTATDATISNPNGSSTNIFFTKSGGRVLTAEVYLEEQPTTKKYAYFTFAIDPLNASLNLICPETGQRFTMLNCSATGSTDWGTPIYTWSATGAFVTNVQSIENGTSANVLAETAGEKTVVVRMYFTENPSFYIEKTKSIQIIVPPPAIEYAECTSEVILGQKVACSASATSDEGTVAYRWTASTGGEISSSTAQSTMVTFKSAGEKTVTLTAYLTEFPDKASVRNFTVNVNDNTLSVALNCPEKAVTDTTFTCSATASQNNYGTVSYRFNVTGGSSYPAGNSVSVKPSNNQQQVSVTVTAYLNEAEWLTKTDTKIIPVTNKSYLTPTVSGNKVTYIGIENTYTATAPCLAKNECSIKFTVNDVEVENSTASFVFATQGRHVIKAIATMGETSVETNYPVFANALPKVYVTIKGPTGAFVGKAETYSVKIPDKYEGLTIRGQWILPNGSTSDSETLEFTPTAKEKTFIKYTAWVDGFKELTEATTSKTVFVNDYVFPKPVIYAQKTTGVAPLTLVFKTSFTEKFVSGAIYRINYKWEIFQGSEIIDTIQTDKSYIVYKFEKTGNYTVKLTATDQYDNSSTDQISVYAALATVEVTLKESVNNKGYRAPLKVYIKPSTTGNKSIADKLLSHEWKINNNTISDTRPHYLMATLPDPGDYTITYTATYSSGLVATGSKTITVNPNRLPTCDISATANSAKTYLALKAQCTDPDGRMASYKWDLGDGRGYVNGTGMMSRKITSGETITIKLYACDDAQGCVEVTKEVTP